MLRNKLIIALTFCVTMTYSQQNLVNGSLAYNSWDDGLAEFMAIEFDYERAFNQKIGLEVGFNYVLPVLDKESGFGIEGSLNFYLKDYTKGFFLGVGGTMGSFSELGYVRFGGELGYNFPLKNSRISPSIGYGIFFVGGDGAYGGGTAIPFKLNYSYFF